MASTRTTVEILNTSLARVAEIRNLYPINNQGTILRYSKELSRWGTALFRVQTKDPIFTTFGDILEPHRYHVRIKRGQTTVWQGAIIDNKERNKNYVEVLAAEYEFYLSKKRINQNTSAPASWDGGTDTGWKNYRNFESGSMASVVTTVMNEAIAGWGANHVLGAMTLGTIETPDYPTGFLGSDGLQLTGEWNFSATVNMQFDYHSIEYVLQSFGLYTDADYYIDNNLVFHFKKFVGNNRQYELTFVYGTTGNIVDYNLPRLGRRMTNDLMGIAVDDNGNVLHIAQRDNQSVTTYGLMEDSSAYTDVKTENMLRTRLAKELAFVNRPEDAPVDFTVNAKGYPLGQYDIGDIITVRIKDYVINYNQARRIIGLTVNLSDTGRELTYVQTKAPRDGQTGEA